MSASAKGLFRATRPGADVGPALIADLPRAVAPGSDLRDPLDYDPTPPDATAAFLAVERAFIAAHLAGSPDPFVWEPAVGGGHMARVLVAAGFDVLGADVVDRGWPGVVLQDFFDVQAALSPVLITNPPYNQINARDGHGRWLRHALDIGVAYCALLLNADWPAARINGFDQLFRDHPPSVEWLCCWKIDFRGKGSPPQRNSWFVWDRNRPAPGPDRWERRRLYREQADPAQGVFF